MNQFEAVFSSCGFSVAGGASKVKKILETIDEVGLGDDEFSFLLFALRQVEIEKVIEKKMEGFDRNANNRKSGGVCGKVGNGSL